MNIIHETLPISIKLQDKADIEEQIRIATQKRDYHFNEFQSICEIAAGNDDFIDKFALKFIKAQSMLTGLVAIYVRTSKHVNDEIIQAAGLPAVKEHHTPEGVLQPDCCYEHRMAWRKRNLTISSGR